MGYYYQQLSGDSGSGAKLGDFKSRVAAVGPQVGFIHKVSARWEAYLNVRAYGEFAAEHRTQGWNMFVTYVISHEAQPRSGGIK